MFSSQWRESSWKWLSDFENYLSSYIHLVFHLYPDSDLAIAGNIVCDGGIQIQTKTVGEVSQEKDELVWVTFRQCRNLSLCMPDIMPDIHVGQMQTDGFSLLFRLPGLWDAGRISARPGSGGRGGSGALIWAGWASPQWAPPPAPSVWPGGAPPPARHAGYLEAIAYFSDSTRPEWWSGRKEEERCVGEIKVERGDEDRGFIKTL